MLLKIIPAAHLLRGNVGTGGERGHSGRAGRHAKQGSHVRREPDRRCSGVQGFTWDGSLRLIRDVVLLYSALATLLFALARRWIRLS
jgi:hypothetical protein